jgi:hypothetical protein
MFDHFPLILVLGKAWGKRRNGFSWVENLKNAYLISDPLIAAAVQYWKDPRANPLAKLAAPEG